MYGIIKNDHPVISFVIGLLSANNIVYVFVVGTTPIMLSCVYAFVCLIYLAIIHSDYIYNTLRSIPKSLELFVIFVVFSIIPIMILHHQYMYQWLVGIIQLFLYCCIIVLVASLDNNKQQLLKGAYSGIIINFLFVMYSFYMYRQGINFSLNDIFPAVHMKIMYIGNTFRGWGLFKEPGHLMRYICVLSFVIWEYATRKSIVHRTLFIISISIMVMFSISSAVIFFLIGIVIYINIKGKQNIKRLVVTIMGLILLVSLTFFLARKNQFVALLISSLKEGIVDIFNLSGGNATRYSGLDYVIKIIKEYPIIGTGWNTLTQIFIEEGYYGVGNVRGSYSEGLSLIAEMGMFSLSYFAFLLKSIKKELNSQISYNNALGTGLLLYTILLFTTDYTIDTGAAVILGLGILSYKEGTQENATIKDIQEDSFSKHL